ncbi:hypothetical protein JCM10449v2_006518 [Rhodotorula kratochvilovae]
MASTAAVARVRGTLLTQLEALYTWLHAWAPNGQPKELREEAVDVLLASFCRAYVACTTRSGATDWAKLVYTNLCHEIGYRGEAQRRNYQAEELLSSLKYSVARLEAFCVTAAADAANLASFERWRSAFFSDAGLNRLKLTRLDEPTCDALIKELADLEHSVKQLHAAGSGLPDLGVLLPPADSLLICSHTAAQSAEDRFNIFALLFEEAADFYSTLAAPRSAAGEQSAEFSRTVRMLEQEHFAAHFATLPVPQQCRAVRLARDALFAACQQLATTNTLPMPSLLMDSFFEAVLHPNVQRIR